MSDCSTLEEAFQSGMVDLETGELLEVPARTGIERPGSPEGGGRSFPGSAERDRGLSYTNKVLEPLDRFSIRNKLTGEVKTFTKVQGRLSRQRRRVSAWAKAIKPVLEDGEKYRRVMITLTYASGDDWRPNQIKIFLQSLRKLLGSRLYAYAWVAELQARGAVHYHVLLVVKKGTKIPEPDTSGMWKWGFSNIQTARTIFYIVKYIGKEHQKVGRFPKGLRIFAVWVADGVIEEMAKWFFRTSSLPGWFRKEVIASIDNWGEKWKRVPGGGWEFTGQVFASPWEYLGKA